MKKKQPSAANKSYRVPLQLRYDLIPPLILERLAAIYEEGAQRYGEAKYLEKPLPYSIVYNHLMNHLMLWAKGDVSEDNLAKVMWGVATLMVYEDLHKNFPVLPINNDMSGYGGHANEVLNKMIATNSTDVLGLDFKHE